MTHYSEILLDDETLVLGSKILYEHKSEFDDYHISGPNYVLSVKMMKVYSGCGLKDSKDLIDLYRQGKLIPSPGIKKERLDKIISLEKNTFVCELMVKINNLNSEDFENVLKGLSIDDLIVIDEAIENEVILKNNK